MAKKLLKFAKTSENQSRAVNKAPIEVNSKPWNILVVDDDQSVHDVTDLILSKYTFDGRPLKLTYAYSATEARGILEKPNDFSVLLLDVVMETEHAGLELVSYIRNVLKNQFIRIILRTGQPGQAPELSVIVDYDINDYRTKTELTAEKMCSCVTSALRGYKDINTIRELALSREQLNLQLRIEIEERFAVEKLLASTNDKLDSIINNSTSLISLKHVDGYYDLVNDTFLNDLEVMNNNVIGKTDYDIFSAAIADSIRANDKKVLETGEAIQCEEFLPSKEGVHCYLSVKFPLFDNDGNIHLICSISTDINERMEAQKKILYLAQYDALTKIPNRSLFIDKLTRAVSICERSERYLAVMFIDLDRFKQINDSLGHDFGDELLVKVAGRLTSIVRDGDLVCRLGGDEFAVLLTEVATEQDIVEMADKIMKTLTRSYLIQSKELMVTASMGISRCPIDSFDVKTLLKKADVAMYKAKKIGRNAYRFYLQEDDSKANELLSLEVDMRKMLAEEKSQFFLLYQPKVCINTGKYLSVEALLRWNHPEKGIIPPFQFIPLLEETGLIIKVGEWVLKEACFFAKRMADAGNEIKVAVNLSSRQLKRKEMLDTIKVILTETECAPHQLELEVTESSFIEDIEGAKLLLEKISALGISLAIDDFGTGYSSINYLKMLPFNTLKIDRSFISEAPSIKQDLAIVTTITQLATNLNMKIVAEGVETAEQFTMIKNLLSDSKDHLIQGYLFSKPVEEEALLKVSANILEIWRTINHDNVSLEH
ncbi:EAL domain-containing protein [Paraglaciecola sp.]|uniref:EAL domain-containing protein n=1 Tax=Paraglaciecola sp. TaxID=1920173 RepID=UPI003262E3A5